MLTTRAGVEDAQRRERAAIIAQVQANEAQVTEVALYNEN
jgi:hypothetical protein